MRLHALAGNQSAKRLRRARIKRASWRDRRGARAPVRSALKHHARHICLKGGAAGIVVLWINDIMDAAAARSRPAAGASAISSVLRLFCSQSKSSAARALALPRGWRRAHYRVLCGLLGITAQRNSGEQASRGILPLLQGRISSCASLARHQRHV